MNQLQKNLKNLVYLRKSMVCDNEWEYVSIEDFVLKNGKIYKTKSTTHKCKKMTIGYCYHNAFITAAHSNGKLNYVEGFASCQDINIPMHHAWCVNKNGTVIEPTWKRKYGKVYYIGCIFPLRYIYNITLKNSNSSGVLDNFKMRFPLLSGKHSYPNLPKRWIK